MQKPNLLEGVLFVDAATDFDSGKHVLGEPTVPNRAGALQDMTTALSFSLLAEIARPIGILSVCKNVWVSVSGKLPVECALVGSWVQLKCTVFLWHSPCCPSSFCSPKESEAGG